MFFCLSSAAKGCVTWPKPDHVKSSCFLSQIECKIEIDVMISQSKQSQHETIISAMLEHFNWIISIEREILSLVWRRRSFAKKTFHGWVSAVKFEMLCVFFLSQLKLCLNFEALLSTLVHIVDFPRRYAPIKWPLEQTTDTKMTAWILQPQ